MSAALSFALAGLLLLAPLAVCAQDRPIQPVEPAPAAPAATASSGPAIAKGSSVGLEYTLTDEAGAVIDSNRGRAPLRYTHGARQLIPGLERELVGLHAGDEKKVVVKPEDAYGAVNPAAQTEVPKTAIPEAARKVGARLLARNHAGEARPVVVKEIRQETILLDLNHPLAGKTLFFDVKVLDVAAPAAHPPQKDAPPAPSEK
ncbi:MAG: peptidylprolyl isomerase [Candidatus Rokubacteria bacterium]|nr:peptidylprolyl isomerase [Candidatus Rokubacteria bacterium]